MTDNIKLPPVPRPQLEKAGWTFYDDSDMEAHAREAVRLNAQTDIRTLIANDAYAMTFQSLGQYRSALLAALSAAPAAPQPAQAVPDGWVLVPVEPTPEMIDAANLARKYREHGALTDPDVLNSRTYNSRQTYAAMLSAAPAAPQPAQQDAKPIYQYQLSTGGWIDQTRDSYEYNKANGVKGLRIVYEAAPQPAQQPLTDEQFQKIRRSLMQQSGWDGDGWDQALKEAIEQAHGIGVKP